MMGWPQLLRLVSPVVVWIALGFVVRADVVCLLEDGTEAWQARLMLIEAAECEIDVAYYAMDSGRVSRR